MKPKLPLGTVVSYGGIHATVIADRELKCDMIKAEENLKLADKMAAALTE